MSTLGTLKSDVDTWLARDDVAVSGTDFTSILLMAESLIATEVKTVVQEKSYEFTVDGRRESAPSDYHSWRALFVDATQPADRRLEFKTPEVIRESEEWGSGTRIKSFSVEGDGDSVEFVFAPAGSASSPTTVEMLYHARFAALSADGDTNWLLTNHYDIYLYATLAAAAEWLQEWELHDRYVGKFHERAAAVNKQEQRKRFGSGAKQSYGSPRTVV